MQKYQPNNIFEITLKELGKDASNYNIQLQIIIFKFALIV